MWERQSFTVRTLANLGYATLASVVNKGMLMCLDECIQSPYHVVFEFLMHFSVFGPFEHLDAQGAFEQDFRHHQSSIQCNL